MWPPATGRHWRAGRAGRAGPAREAVGPPIRGEREARAASVRAVERGDAGRPGMAAATVKTDLNRLLGKPELHDRAQAAFPARELGFGIGQESLVWTS